MPDLKRSARISKNSQLGDELGVGDKPLSNQILGMDVFVSGETFLTMEDEMGGKATCLLYFESLCLFTNDPNSPVPVPPRLQLEGWSLLLKEAGLYPSQLDQQQLCSLFQLAGASPNMLVYDEFVKALVVLGRALDGLDGPSSLPQFASDRSSFSSDVDLDSGRVRRLVPLLSGAAERMWLRKSPKIEDPVEAALFIQACVLAWKTRCSFLEQCGACMWIQACSLAWLARVRYRAKLRSRLVDSKVKQVQEATKSPTKKWRLWSWSGGSSTVAAAPEVPHEPQEPPPQGPDVDETRQVDIEEEQRLMVLRKEGERRDLERVVTLWSFSRVQREERREAGRSQQERGEQTRREQARREAEGREADIKEERRREAERRYEERREQEARKREETEQWRRHNKSVPRTRVGVLLAADSTKTTDSPAHVRMTTSIHYLTNITAVLESRAQRGPSVDGGGLVSYLAVWGDELETWEATAVIMSAPGGSECLKSFDEAKNKKEEVQRRISASVTCMKKMEKAMGGRAPLMKQFKELTTNQPGGEDALQFHAWHLWLEERGVISDRFDGEDAATLFTRASQEGKFELGYPEFVIALVYTALVAHAQSPTSKTAKAKITDLQATILAHQLLGEADLSTNPSLPVGIPGNNKKKVSTWGSEEEESVVEKIVESRPIKGSEQLLIKWKGYSSADNTWEERGDVESYTGGKAALAWWAELQTHKETQRPPSPTKLNRPQLSPPPASRKPAPAPAKKPAPAPAPPEEDVVEAVVRTRTAADGGVEGLVKWVGYGSGNNTWEAWNDLEAYNNGAAAIAKYEDTVLETQRNPRPPSPTKIARITSSSKAPPSPSKQPAKPAAVAKAAPATAATQAGEDAVESITKTRTVKGVEEFWVKWKGYGVGDSTWERLSDIKQYKNGPVAIKQWEKSQSASGGSKVAVPTPRGEEDAVESLMKVRNTKGVDEYWVKWKGWGIGDSTWERLSDIKQYKNGPAAIKHWESSSQKQAAAKPATAAKPQKAAKPAAEEEAEEDTVESIAKARVINGITELFVKWKGYDAVDNTWEVLTDVKQYKEGVVALQRWEMSVQKENSK